MKLFGVLMVFAVVAAFAQADLSLLLPGEYPVPEWVRPGLVVVYQYEGGIRSAGGSAASGSGFRIDVVTNVENNRVYGIEFLILVSLSTYEVMIQPIRVMPLMVFLHPGAIQDLLDQAGMLAQQGIVVRGGRVSENSIWVGIEDDVSSTDIWVSDEGLVQRFQYLVREREGSSVVQSQYLKHFYIDWPDIEDFPPVSQENHTYSIYVSAYGMTTPAGSVSYELLNTQGSILIYRLIQYSSGMSIPAEIMGVPSFGPFYIHSELLEKDVILEIPEIGFVWQNEQGEYGVDSVVYFNGQECFRAALDERGLIIGVQYLQEGFVIITELAE
ncbi:hypothetical protein [Thermotoga neapolitana]|uniref:Uncharacterized protein n=1 Tax=Thermotoga neapolitana (strain ATCC 49049 / DSM 4359 / NBRC 107923 / NS-E) TaxID=309803 RepID=B9K9U8_THENN|nr:hypothetical protein [Thermotoga neapolitana]ACM23731.1 Putative uncharacterized protein precursor [Thermotoga neapolitana DSM 4359]KFZ21343.1 hypothetical protein LA10_08229 [Thermotoga neapolitana LA10]HBF10205.1 hypothetical protein [Thermotoga neapolitana]